MSGATATATPRSKGEANKLKASTKPVIKVDSSFTAPKWNSLSLVEIIACYIIAAIKIPDDDKTLNHIVLECRTNANEKRPTVDSAQQDIILKLLCNLLEPIGHHKTAHIILSKGKRSKKRKRADEDKNIKEKNSDEQNAIPPSPSISKHITLGYNSTFRHLQETIKPSELQATTKDETPSTQSISNQRQESGKAETSEKEHQDHDVGTTNQSGEAKPSKTSEQEHRDHDKETTNQSKEVNPSKTPEKHPYLSTIFLTAPSPSTHPPYTPLPLLGALSSIHYPSLPPTRLIPLSIGSEAKLCATLGIPRVGIIGLFEDAPGARGLVEYVRENVEVVDVPWVKEVGKGEWLGTKILFGGEGKRVDGA